MFDDFKITIREILFSITIICVMVGLGILLSNHLMSDWYEKEMSVFSSVKIENNYNKFDYIMRTNAGDFLADGVLEAANPVSITDIKGSYLKIRKVKETYNVHTRTYTTSDGKGHTQTHTQIYWSWDYSGEDNFVADSIRFLGKTFVFDSIEMKKWPDCFDTTINETSHLRYKYSAYPERTNGMMLGKAQNKSFSNLSFVSDTNIQKYLEKTEKKGKIINISFWVLWMLLTGGIVFLFYAADNEWLED